MKLKIVQRNSSFDDSNKKLVDPTVSAHMKLEFCYSMKLHAIGHTIWCRITLPL